MFGLFKRTKIEEWEISLLKNTLDQLPIDLKELHEQINSGLFRGVLVGMSDIPGYVAFTYNFKVLSRFDDRNKKDFKITGIKIDDKKTKKQLLYTIYVSSGTINGYSIEGANKFTLDIESVNVSEYKLVFKINDDYNEICKILSSSEADLLTPGEIYKVVLNGKIYYHLRELEDGDFIGMDAEKKVYKITHDPFEIIQVHKNLKDALL